MSNQHEKVDIYLKILYLYLWKTSRPTMACLVILHSNLDLAASVFVAQKLRMNK